MNREIAYALCYVFVWAICLWVVVTEVEGR